MIYIIYKKKKKIQDTSHNTMICSACWKLHLQVYVGSKNDPPLVLSLSLSLSLSQGLVEVTGVDTQMGVLVS
jgi:hypothetical protein